MLFLAGFVLFASAPIYSALAKQLDPASDGLVFDPPSNVRVTPNGQILCKITTKRRISIWNDKVGGNDWYATNACGSKGTGYIHQSQVNHIRSHD